VFDLFAGLTTADPLTDVESARLIFAGLDAHAPAALPDRWGYFEPLTERWTDATLTQESWLDEAITWRTRRAADAEGWVSPVSRFGKQPRGNVGLSADRQRVDPLGIQTWLRSLAGPLRADYGYLHIASEPDVVTGRRAPGSITEAEEGFHLMQSAATISQAGIAELLWGTVFGPAYVALIGADPIRSAPAAQVEEIATDTYWLQITDKATDPLEDWAAFDTARQAVKKHLGARLFWDRDDSSPRLIPQWTAT